MEEWSRSGSLSQRKNIRSVKFDRIDQALLQWFTEQRSHGAPISDPLLLEKAKQFAEELGQKPISKRVRGSLIHSRIVME